MPNEREHTIATIGSYASIATLMAVNHQPVDYIAACAAGFITSFWINPDLDLSKKLPKDIKKFPWWVLWLLYGKFFKHRSFWTHTPLIGTTLRIAYALGVILIVLNLMGIHYNIYNLYLGGFYSVLLCRISFIYPWISLRQH